MWHISHIMTTYNANRPGMIEILKNEPLEHMTKHVTQWHAHPSGQLYWLSRGMITVETDHDQWAITAGAVGWLPPNCSHKGTAFGEMRGWSLQIGETFSQQLPPQAQLCRADSFLCALLGRISQFGQALTPSQLRLMEVLADELRQATVLPMQLKMPVDRRALSVATLLLDAPATSLSQQELAARYGMSVRTLSRLFNQETGVAFSRWRQQARILRSLAFLAQGDTVSDVAHACGYENVSAYIAAFKARFGITPTQILHRY